MAGDNALRGRSRRKCRWAMRMLSSLPVGGLGNTQKSGAGFQESLVATASKDRHCGAGHDKAR